MWLSLGGQMHPSYLDLSRAFVPYTASGNVEEAVVRSYFAGLGGEALHWPKLCESRHVVVLAEAGAGKTWEFRAEAERRRSNGDFAFFARLDVLATRPLREAFDLGNEKELDQWLKSPDRDAIFFLDSIDEARLTKSSHFVDAIRSFVAGIDGSLNRCRTVISCRISEWRGDADHYELQHILQVTPQSTSAKTSRSKEQSLPLVVELSPLNTDQIEKLAVGLGEGNAKGFVEALRTQDAFAFAGRPIDAKNLLRYWQTKGKLGSLTDILEFDLIEKLRETAERARQDSLSPDGARKGAEALAAAALLGRKLVFYVPGSTVSADAAPSALDARRALPGDWTEEKALALLSRPLFDEATYGRIRFHHRIVAEYLAAEWFAHRMAEGCPYDALETLFIKTSRGADLLKESSAPVAVWLAGKPDHWARSLLRRILKVSPSSLFQHGDPQAFSPEVRREILTSLVARYATDSLVRFEIDDAQLRRLSCNEIANDILPHIPNKALIPELRILLIKIVRVGMLRQCLPSLQIVAADPTEDDEIRRYALRAIFSLDEQTSLTQLRSDIKHWASVPSYTSGLLVRSMYPMHLSTTEMIDLLRRTQSPQRGSYGGIDYILETHAKTSVPDALLDELLENLVLLGKTPPFISAGAEPTSISDRFFWLGNTIAVTAARMMRRSSLTESAASHVASALLFMRQHRKLNIVGQADEPLQKLSEAHPRVRQLYVERIRAAYKAKHANAGKADASVGIHFIFDYYGPLKPSPSDCKWIISSLTSALNQAARQEAFDFAIETWWELDRNKPFLREIKRAARLAGIPRSQVRQKAPGSIASFIRRTKQKFLDEVRFGFGHRKYVWQERYRNYANLRFFKKRLRQLRAGKNPRLLQFVLSQHRETSSSYEPKAWATLGPVVGYKVAKATRIGCKRIWRTYHAPIGMERVTGWTQSFVIAALAGIRAEIEDGLDWARLTQFEAEAAARCAVSEINRFPDWTEALARHHPDALRWILFRCVNIEWAFGDLEKCRSRVLAYGSNATTSVTSLLAEILPTYILSGPSKKPDDLQSALEILLGNHAPISPALIGSISLRLKAGRVSDQFAPTLLNAWLYLQPDKAIEWLEYLALHDAPLANSMLLLLSSHLGDSFRGPIAHGTRVHALPIDLSLRLIPLICSAVEIGEDIDRSNGGVYSPGVRDNAQDFRNALLTRFAERTDSGVYEALVQLSSDPRMAGYSFGIGRAIRNRALQDAEGSAWEPQEIPLFAKTYSSKAHSSADLFRITLNRLSDIKSRVEAADFSWRGNLRSGDDEATLQTWLAGKLEDTSRDVYSVVREPEVDRKKKPDIRLTVPGLGPTTIEIKWAHDWTGNQLDGTLPNQIVGQYMRANNSRFGVLVLANFKPNKKWQPDGTAEVDFKGLTARLTAQAKDILRTNDEIEGLNVVSLEFY